MKAFKVAQSGPTADGREIKPQWLREIAETYNTAVYTSRIWLEHLRGMYPNSDFRAAGLVSKVFSKEHDGIVSLYAELDPNDYAKALNADDQKIFTSIEITENFANSGKAYLTGLALTDSPASLGTDVVTFSAQTSFKNPLPGAHQFYATAEIDLTDGWEGIDIEDKKTGFNLIAALTDALKKAFNLNKTAATEPAQPTEPAASLDFNAIAEEVSGAVSAALSEQEQRFTQQLQAMSERVTELSQRLETAQNDAQNDVQNHSQRPASAGGEAGQYVKADC